MQDEDLLEELKAVLAEADAQILKGEAITFDPREFQIEQDKRFADLIEKASHHFSAP